MANSDKMFREIMGIETEDGFERIEFEYQNILDNVTLLDDETVRKLNDVVVEMGHGMFKKKMRKPNLLTALWHIFLKNISRCDDFRGKWI
jgi:hypothetical protein